MKYRKTALVEAEQFLPSIGQIPSGVISDGNGDPRRNPERYSWIVASLEGNHHAKDGDYICTGIKGEKWVVDKEIFEATYELVNAAAPPLREACKNISNVRPSVALFAVAMENKLRANDHKTGWKYITDGRLWHMLNNELIELRKEVFPIGKVPQSQTIQNECADVANFCMMIFDNTLEPNQEIEKDASYFEIARNRIEGHNVKVRGCGDENEK